MNHASVEPQRWSRARWWSVLALVCTFQLALIFWLGARGPVYADRTAPVPTLRIAGPAFDELVGLTDPTLFALPHQQGFAGPAWLSVPQIGAAPFVWSEPPSWLPLSLEQLGAVFRAYVATNQFVPPIAPTRREPEFRPPDLIAAPDLPQNSVVRLTGGLAQLGLAGVLSLTSWTNAESLTNSVVQLLVGDDGRPVSVTLLISSGLKEADQWALRQAVQARFQPPTSRPGLSPRSRGGLTWGQMVFEWYTLAPASAGSAH